jgi:glycosyltransferase involved in cell wall biosynthesis
MYFSSLEQFFQARFPGTAKQEAKRYGSRLSAVVVKYAREAARAVAVLGAPVTVVRNGIDVPAGADVPAPDRPGLVLGTAARLSPDKKLEQLIDAFRRALPRLPGARLRIAGGPEPRFAEHATELRRRAEGLPIEWCGDVRDVPAFLSGLDVFAMISEPAGCPNASLEAMTMGLPIVATDHGGASEQVIDGVTGILVPRGDVFAFAEALVRLGRDADLRRKFGEAGREHVRREFSMEAMLARYEALIVGKVESVFASPVSANGASLPHPLPLNLRPGG